MFLPPRNSQTFFACKTLPLLDTVKVISLDISSNNQGDIERLGGVILSLMLFVLLLHYLKRDQQNSIVPPQDNVRRHIE